MNGKKGLMIIIIITRIYLTKTSYMGQPLESSTYLPLLEVLVMQTFFFNFFFPRVETKRLPII